MIFSSYCPISQLPCIVKLVLLFILYNFKFSILNITQTYFKRVWFKESFQYKPAYNYYTCQWIDTQQTCTLSIMNPSPSILRVITILTLLVTNFLFFSSPSTPQFPILFESPPYWFCPHPLQKCSFEFCQRPTRC